MFDFVPCKVHLIVNDSVNKAFSLQSENSHLFQSLFFSSNFRDSKNCIEFVWIVMDILHAITNYNRRSVLNCKIKEKKRKKGDSEYQKNALNENHSLE